MLYNCCMKHLFILHRYKFITLALLSALFLAAYEGPNFPRSATNGGSHIVFIEGSFDEALRQAKIQNKYIFVDAYASWCGPCKMLKTNTFTNDKAAAFFNSTFVNVSIDMEKGQGPDLAEKWGIQAYPTLIIFNPQGKPVLGTVGYINASQLMQFGKQALAK
jgi:thioredoxin 1